MASSPPPRPPLPPKPTTPVRNPMFSARLWITLGIILLVNVFVTNVLFAPAQPASVALSYDVFKQQVAAGNVIAVTTTGDAIAGVTKTPVKESSPSTASATHFTTQRPSCAADSLEPLLEQHGVTINAKPENPPPPLWLTLLLSFGPTLLIVFAVLYLIRRAAAAGGTGGLLGAFGQSRARLYDPERVGTTFADVAGIDEVRHELEELVDFLREPQKYERLGGMVPKGVLLIGPPGTGKTLLARAVAGEAKVPFFSQSASEFVEAIVGVGASRVRDLFTKARQAAPAIIFIDELDAVGRSRSSGIRLGSNDEQEQTLNQILTEMEGSEPVKGVIVLAPTNRADVLDQALLRPGRFDRRVTLQPPDRRGRAAILQIHTAKMPLAPGGDPDGIAAATARPPRRHPRRHSRPGRRRPPQPCERGRSGGREARQDHCFVTGFLPGHRSRAARHRATPGDDAGRSRTHRLSRVGARPARFACAGCGPRAQGDDHSARGCIGSNHFAPYRRSVQLRGGLPAGEDCRRPWRAGGRAAGLWRRVNGSRERPSTGERHHSPDGGDVGHEPEDRPAGISGRRLRQRARLDAALQRGHGTRGRH